MADSRNNATLTGSEHTHIQDRLTVVESLMNQLTWISRDRIESLLNSIEKNPNMTDPERSKFNELSQRNAARKVIEQQPQTVDLYKTIGTPKEWTPTPAQAQRLLRINRQNKHHAMTQTERENHKQQVNNLREKALNACKK